MSRGDVSLSELGRRRYSNFVARASCHIFRSYDDAQRIPLGDCRRIRKNFGRLPRWHPPRTERPKASPLSFGSCRNCALSPQTKNFTRVFSSSPPFSCNLVYKHTRVRGRAFMPEFCASPPLAILPVRLTKEPTTDPAYLVCGK